MSEVRLYYGNDVIKENIVMPIRKTRRPQGSTELPVRSVRVGDALWAKARHRATYEGVTMSDVLYTIVEGYAAGLIDLPKVQTVFSQPRTTAS